jgi:hypothetical protein
MRGKAPTAVVLLLVGFLIGGGSWATARSFITTRDIKNGTIRNRDIRPGVIMLNRLTPSVRRLIRRGGRQGAPGAPGAPGSPGAPGGHGQPGSSTPTLTSGDFGVIDRSTFGSPVAQLRSGPGDPPSGSGSLSLLVAGGPNFNPAEKMAYGKVESGLLARLKAVGFAVFTTAANIARGTNMPNIQFEVNPHISDAGGAITFSTLTFNAVNTAAGTWTTIDATDPDAGRWALTGRAGTATGCASLSATSGCTLGQIEAKLPDATLISVVINKGRDFEWQGAVDALRVNDRVADFEEGGVIIRAA